MKLQTPIALLEACDKGLPTALSIEVMRYARLAGKVKELDPTYALDRAKVKRWLVNLGWRFNDEGVEPPGPFIERQRTSKEFKKAVEVAFDKLWDDREERAKPTTPDERLTLACWMSHKLIRWKATGELP